VSRQLTEKTVMRQQSSRNSAAIVCSRKHTKLAHCRRTQSWKLRWSAQTAILHQGRALRKSRLRTEMIWGEARLAIEAVVLGVQSQPDGPARRGQCLRPRMPGDGMISPNRGVSKALALPHSMSGVRRAGNLLGWFFFSSIPQRSDLGVGSVLDSVETSDQSC
jgi:hypothetical protein